MEHKANTYELIDRIADIVKRDDDARTMPNISSIVQIRSEFELIKQMFGDEVTLELKLHKPFKSMGYISIIGPVIEPNDPELFLEICKRSNNLEFYPRTDGCAQCNITYHNLMLKE